MKQDSGNGWLHQRMSIPLEMLFDKNTHGAMKILRQLIFHTDARGYRIRGLAQLRPLAVNPPIRPCQPTGCQNSEFLTSKQHRSRKTSGEEAFAFLQKQYFTSKHDF